MEHSFIITGLVLLPTDGLVTFHIPAPPSTRPLTHKCAPPSDRPERPLPLISVSRLRCLEWMWWSRRYGTLLLVNYQCKCAFVTIVASHRHTRRPLPLGTGWLPRLRCRLSSSCCYETRTDRPELNDNVSGSKSLQEPIRDRLDKHFPVWGRGTSRAAV